MHFGHQLLARPDPLAVGLPPLGLGAIVRHEPTVVAASERATEGAGPAAGPAPISPPWRCVPPWRGVPPWRCSLLLLPDDPAGHQPTGHQQRTSTQRQQRRCATTTGLRKLLRRCRSRGRCRGWCRGWRRRRGSLRRRRRRRWLTRGLGHYPTSLRLYHAILTLGLGLRSSGLGLLGLGIGHHGRLVLGESGRSGQHGHRQHRRQHHQLPQLTYLLLLESLFPWEADPLRERIRLPPRAIALLLRPRSG